MTTRPAPRPLIDLPPGWCTRPDPDPAVLLSARPARHTPSGATPTLVLTLTAPAPPSADLEDTDSYVDDEGREVLYRRWSAREEPGLVRESWSWPDVPGAPCLVATVDREDYLDHCDLFEWTAELVDPDVLASRLADLPRGA